MKGKGKDWNGP